MRVVLVLFTIFANEWLIWPRIPKKPKTNIILELGKFARGEKRSMQKNKNKKYTHYWHF